MLDFILDKYSDGNDMTISIDDDMDDLEDLAIVSEDELEE